MIKIKGEKHFEILNEILLEMEIELSKKDNDDDR
jgi:hypothetical protein